MKQANLPIHYFEVDGGDWKVVEAEIITETPVSLTVNGEVLLTFMCTPTDLEAMAVGFLFNEGVIQSMKEVIQARLCTSGDNVDIWLDHNAEKPGKWQRTSGCTGGVTSVDVDRIVPVEGSQNGATLSPKQVRELVANLINAQISTGSPAESTRQFSAMVWRIT